MNRRKFLSWLGVGAAAVVVAPSALLATKDSLWQVNTGYCTLGLKEYAEYTNFSEFACSQAIDDVVANAAAELGRAAALEINNLYGMVPSYGA